MADHSGPGTQPVVETGIEGLDSSAAKRGQLCYSEYRYRHPDAILRVASGGATSNLCHQEANRPARANDSRDETWFVRNNDRRASSGIRRSADRNPIVCGGFAPEGER